MNRTTITILLLFLGIIMFTLSIRSLKNFTIDAVTISFTLPTNNNITPRKNDTGSIDYFSLKTPQANQTASGMPKLLWIYWDKGLSHLESLTKYRNKYRTNFVFVKAMIEMNPSWNVLFLDQESATDYAPIFTSIIRNQTLSDKLLPSMKSDVLRLELLSLYGGVWADTSICPFLPLDDFITDWVGIERNGFFANPANLAFVNRSDLSIIDDIPFCHDHSKVNRSVGKGSPFRTSSNWFMASTNPHNPLVDEWLSIFSKHLLSGDSSLPYFLAHCSLTQARLNNETVDSIWLSTRKRYGRKGSKVSKIACLGVDVRGERSHCAIAKKPPGQYVLSRDYSLKIIQAEARPQVFHDIEVSHPSDTNHTDEDEHKIRRQSAMNGSAGVFSYVHISKCSGSTWVMLLKQQNLTVFPAKRAGYQEFSVNYQKRTLGTKAAYHSTSLRSPRHHVFSMFMHCKYFNKKKSGFQWNGTDETDFIAWLDHHLPMGMDNRDMYRCFFHPANYQSRHLTSSAIRPHGLEAGDPFEPNLNSAMQTYWELDFVSLTEFTHESRCLLYYRLKSNTTLEALKYLEHNCRCDAGNSTNEEVETKDNLHITHHKGTHRSNLMDLPQDILTKVDDLTRIDVVVYSIALRQFMDEIAWLESKTALGRRVLCNTVLKSLEPELSYLPAANGQATNITKLYLEASGRTI